MVGCRIARRYVDAERMTATSLAFRPIDLDRYGDQCVEFRRDSFICSFGTDDAFFEQNGPDGERYIAWLSEHLAELPESCVHVWKSDTIVGQMEMHVRDDPGVGYINLFYLIPSARGSGAGDQLHDYALRLFRKLNVTKLQLSVSTTNRRAVAYYRKHGWRDLGPRPDHEDVHLMELTVSGTT
jgi:ribosomal protein S18 acetylase RimI-like enzyme